MMDDGRSGLQPSGSREPSQQAVSAAAAASIPNAEALVRLLDEYMNIPSKDFYEHWPEFCAARDKEKERNGGKALDATFDTVLDIVEHLASAMSAGTAETAQQAQGQRPAHNPIEAGDAQ